MQATMPTFELEREAQPHESIATRYQSLIRLAESIRAQRDPRELFNLLARELCRVVQFDAIAQYDEGANKVHWHLGWRCRPHAATPRVELPKEETLAWWVHHHQEPV